MAIMWNPRQEPNPWEKANQGIQQYLANSARQRAIEEEQQQKLRLAGYTDLGDGPTNPMWDLLPKSVRDKEARERMPERFKDADIIVGTTGFKAPVSAPDKLEIGDTWTTVVGPKGKIKMLKANPAGAKKGKPIFKAGWGRKPQTKGKMVVNKWDYDKTTWEETNLLVQKRKDGAGTSAQEKKLDNLRKDYRKIYSQMAGHQAGVGIVSALAPGRTLSVKEARVILENIQRKYISLGGDPELLVGKEPAPGEINNNPKNLDFGD